MSELEELLERLAQVQRLHDRTDHEGERERVIQAVVHGGDTGIAEVAAIAPLSARAREPFPAAQPLPDVLGFNADIARAEVSRHQWSGGPLGQAAGLMA